MKSLSSITLVPSEDTKELFYYYTNHLPHVEEFDIEGKKLILIGTKHSHDIADPQFEILKEFLINQKPDIVLGEIDRAQFEGDRAEEFFRYVQDNPHLFHEFVTVYGLTNYCLFIGYTIGSAISGIEPSTYDKIKFLQEYGFTNQEIYFYFSYVQHGIWKRMNNENISREKVMAALHPEFKQLMPDIDYSYNAYETLLNKFIDEEGSMQRVNDKYFGGIGHELPNVLMDFVDCYFVNQITHHLNRSRAVVVVMGLAHSVRLTQSYKNILK